VKASAYHAGLKEDVRTRVQDTFARGALPVVCATNAFGMGIDRPDVDAVVHYAIPG
jgi:ATP-dependent DNA helicase RecQ